MLQNLWQWIKKKALEKSTYSGLIMFLSALGLKLSTGIAENIYGLIAAAVSLYEVIRNERR